MTIKYSKRGSRPAKGTVRDGRRFVRDARRAATSTESGRFWYGIWRTLRAA